MNSRFAVITVVGAAVLAVPLSAQVRGMGTSPGSFSAHRGIVGGFNHARQQRTFGPRPLYWANPYLYAGYDTGYYEQGPMEAPPPQPMYLPTQVAAAPQASAPEPLLLERQGDHWVRVPSNNQGPPAAQPVESSGPTSARAGQKNAPEPPREAPATVLVFRDGRKQEVSGYSIIGPALYTSADYWTSGSWTKKILIADLDIPATRKVNEEHGVKFDLPAGPNEVVIRP